MMVMDELQSENKQLRDENQQLRDRVLELEAMVKKLTELLGQNSRNSSWPSSRDKARKPKPKSQRKSSGRKPGGQKGHRGHTLKMTAKPDEIVIHQPTCCHHCQTTFNANSTIIDIRKRQVLDLPPLHYITTEHQAHTVGCQQCGKVTTSAFPEHVTQPVQYGVRVKQLAVYLRTEQFVPYQRSQQLLQDLFELPVCVGSLQNFVTGAAKRATEPTESIRAAIAQADVVHADETGFYIGGKRHWLHTASTQTLSYFFPHATRGRKAVDEVDILPNVTGTLVHDAWPTYFLYDTVHALCHAHHLRDLTALIENDKEVWAGQMRAFLLAAKALVDEEKASGSTRLPETMRARIETLYDAIVTYGLAETPLPTQGKNGRPKATKGRNLVERFGARKDSMLRFIRDFKVPFDNNLAERDIRMMKVQQKVSGCFRSESGANDFCTLRSYTSTIRKQGLSVWKAIGSLFSDTALMPRTTPV